MKFCYVVIITGIGFITLLIFLKGRYSNWLPTLLKQFFQNTVFYFLTEYILLEFDQCLVIYIFPKSE